MRHVMREHNCASIELFRELLPNIRGIRTMQVQHVFRRQPLAVRHVNPAKIVEHALRFAHTLRQIR